MAKEINLLDVIDLEFLQQFQDKFASVVNVAALIFDRDQKAVTQPSNFGQACTEFHRKSCEGLRRCILSETLGAEKTTRTGKPAIYHCENGLVDFVAPIMLNNERIGAIFGGQVLSKSPDKRKFIKHAHELDVDPEAYWKAISQVKVVPEKNILEAAQLLYLVCSKISLMIANQLRKEELQQETNKAYELLTAMSSSVSDGVFAVDNEGNILHMNPSASAILGLTGKNVIGQNLHEAMGPNDKFSEIVKHRLWRSDVEIALDQGKERIHCIRSSRPILQEDGAITGAVFTLRETKKVHRLVNRMTGATAWFTCADIIGDSEGIKKALKLIKIAAGSHSSVLLTGESGTGKEVFAQAIHNHSERQDGPFVAVNCGGLPRELIQSELFGYEEGAFTGAKRGGNPGKFELANGGTIFLDEIGDMPMELQVNLLRVLQEHRILRIGGDKFIPLNVRVIAATHKDLPKDIEEGRFRQDLYYRLNVLGIQIPPLRERDKDIELITNHWLHFYAESLKKAIRGADQEFYQAVKNYSWPGNIRELQNAVEYAVNVAEGEILTVNDLPRSVLNFDSTVLTKGTELSLSEIERITVEAALKQFNGNISKAAKVLGIGRNTLYDKIKKWGIQI